MTSSPSPSPSPSPCPWVARVIRVMIRSGSGLDLRVRDSGGSDDNAVVDNKSLYDSSDVLTVIYTTVVSAYIYVIYIIIIIIVILYQTLDTVYEVYIE